MTTMIRGRVVLPHEVLDGGVLTVEDGRVRSVWPRPSPPRGGRPADGPDGRPGQRLDLDGCWVLPGFVDLHVHGGGGRAVTDGDPEAAAEVVRFHRCHGTTRLLASLVTGPPDQMRGAVTHLARWVVEQSRQDEGPSGAVVGLHLEGPFLSQSQCGAQDPRWVRHPDPAELAALLDAGRGTVRVVTLAPELAGSLELLSRLRRQRVIAAVGHTDASYAQAALAFAAGASLVTHAGNGMRPAHHREPGVMGAAFDRADVICEIIADEVHLHPATIRSYVRNVGADRVALVTDAMAAAGQADGRYDLGGQAVQVDGGVARVEGSGSLAGSTLTMDAAVRCAATELGFDPAAVSQMASLVPARVLGLDRQLGSLEAGKRADIVVLDERWQVVAVVSDGVVVHGAGRLGVDRL